MRVASARLAVDVTSLVIAIVVVAAVAAVDGSSLVVFAPRDRGGDPTTRGPGRRRPSRASFLRSPDRPHRASRPLRSQRHSTSAPRWKNIDNPPCGGSSIQ
jgi:hypothetical protein